MSIAITTALYSIRIEMKPSLIKRYRKSTAIVPINSAYRLKLDRIDAEHITSVRDNGNRITYSIEMNEKQISMIKSKIMERANFRNMDMSEMELNNMPHKSMIDDMMMEWSVDKDQVSFIDVTTMPESDSDEIRSCVSGFISITVVLVVERHEGSTKIILCMIRDVDYRDTITYLE
jgi:hypothetical protein